MHLASLHVGLTTLHTLGVFFPFLFLPNVLTLGETTQERKRLRRRRGHLVGSSRLCCGIVFRVCQRAMIHDESQLSAAVPSSPPTPGRPLHLSIEERVTNLPEPPVESAGSQNVILKSAERSSSNWPPPAGLAEPPTV